MVFFPGDLSNEGKSRVAAGLQIKQVEVEDW